MNRVTSSVVSSARSEPASLTRSSRSVTPSPRRTGSPFFQSETTCRRCSGREDLDRRGDELVSHLATRRARARELLPPIVPPPHLMIVPKCALLPQTMLSSSLLPHTMLSSSLLLPQTTLSS